MSNSVELLRMLEPAVRPGGLPGPARSVAPPIEARSFESLLEDAKSRVDADVQPAGASDEAGKPRLVDPLKALSRIDLIDNAALLRMMGSSTDL